MFIIWYKCHPHVILIFHPLRTQFIYFSALFLVQNLSSHNKNWMNFHSQDLLFFNQNPLPRPYYKKPVRHIPTKRNSWIPPPLFYTRACQKESRQHLQPWQKWWWFDLPSSFIHPSRHLFHVSHIIWSVNEQYLRCMPISRQVADQPAKSSCSSSQKISTYWRNAQELLILFYFTSLY